MDRLALVQVPHRAFGLASLIRPQLDPAPLASDPSFSPTASLLADEQSQAVQMAPTLASTR